MDEKLWLKNAALFIIILGILNLFGMLRPVWLLAATIFSLYLLFHEWVATKVIEKVKSINKELVLLFVAILFLGLFGYIAINTDIDVALRNSDKLTGRINDSLALTILGVTLALYIRK